MYKIIPLIILVLSGCTAHQIRVANDTLIIRNTCKEMLDVELEYYCRQRNDFYFYNYWSLTSFVDIEYSEYNKLSEYGKDKLFIMVNRLYFMKREQCGYKKNSHD